RISLVQSAAHQPPHLPRSPQDSRRRRTGGVHRRVQHWHRVLRRRRDRPLARELADTFNDLFTRADCQHHRRFQRMRHTRSDAVVTGPDWTLLLTGPGRGHRALKQTLAHDFSRAKSIHIMSAYFLPNLRLLRELKRAAKRGVKVQLILAGRSDIWLMRIATRGLYSSLLRAGVEIY